MVSKKKRIVSLFSGCGGMDLGFEGGFRIQKNQLNHRIYPHWISEQSKATLLLKETGFETVFANDINPHAQVSWENYFSKKREIDGIYHLGSIVDVVKEHKKSAAILPDNIDVVTGGFPCQDFSLAGWRKGFNSHKDHLGNFIEGELPSEETRGKLYMWMKEVIEITNPSLFIAENVKGLNNMGLIKKIIQQDFQNTSEGGYLVLEPQVLHAGNFGVAQSRERLFFIGLKKSALSKKALEELSKPNINLEYSPYPSATHFIPKRKNLSRFKEEEMDPIVKSGDLLSSLNEPEQSSDLSQKMFSKAKFMGSNLQGQIEIDKQKLAPTIRSEHHGNIEFRRLSRQNGGQYIDELKNGLKERRLTPRECARIQSFPDDFEMVIPKANSKRYLVSPSNAYKLVGNAVPPLLAYHLAQQIEKNWDFYFEG